MQDEPNRPYIIIVGAADTGRAPMAAAMLQRHLQRRGIDAIVESAGVLGHDGDPASEEARRTIEQMGLDIEAHIARSLSQELVDRANLLIAIDSGVLKVSRGHFQEAAERIHSLGELAGQERDIPDPFKMQIGAWLAYATEIDQLLSRALPRILKYIQSQSASEDSQPAEAPPAPDTSLSDVNPARVVGSPPLLKRISAAQLRESSTAATAPEAARRMLQVLDLILTMPHIISWNAARVQIAGDLDALLSNLPASDLASGLAGLIRAALSMTPTTPSATQALALREAIAALTTTVQVSALTQMSAQLANWGMTGEQ